MRPLEWASKLGNLLRRAAAKRWFAHVSAVPISLNYSGVVEQVVLARKGLNHSLGT